MTDHGREKPKGRQPAGAGAIIMQRRSAILGSVLFLFIAPAMIAGFVPWWISRWQVQASFFGFASVRAAGVALIAIGIPVLLESFALALQGQGTPAPVAPTRHLVVTGSYRYARNPIYLAVTAIVLTKVCSSETSRSWSIARSSRWASTSSCWPMRSRRCGR